MPYAVAMAKVLELLNAISTMEQSHEILEDERCGESGWKIFITLSYDTVILEFTSSSLPSKTWKC